MKTTIEVKLKPFLIPNFVIVDAVKKPRQEGFLEGPKYKLSELSAETLEAMCEDFTKSVFKKAGKCRPSQPEAEAYREVLEQGVSKICHLLGVDPEYYDRDQSDFSCYADFLNDVAEVVKMSGIKFDNENGGFIKP